MKKTEKLIPFCPVPYCKGIMKEQPADAMAGAGNGNKEQKTIWVCPCCNFIYTGSRPMDIWKEVAEHIS